MSDKIRFTVRNITLLRPSPNKVSLPRAGVDGRVHGGGSLYRTFDERFMKLFDIFISNGVAALTKRLEVSMWAETYDTGP